MGLEVYFQELTPNLDFGESGHQSVIFLIIANSFYPEFYLFSPIKRVKKYIKTSITLAKKKFVLREGGFFEKIYTPVFSTHPN